MPTALHCLNMPAQLMEFTPPGPQWRPGLPCLEGHPKVHSWKTASGGSQPGASFLSRLKAAPGLRFGAFRGRDAEGQSDAENRLTAVVITTTGHRSEFGYDGMGRRVAIRELDPDQTQTLQVTSDKKYLWDGVEIAQERSTDGGTVLRQFYEQGFVDTDGTILFYTRDHMDSIRELTDANQSVRARYDYDPYGRMTKVIGDKDSLLGYTGHHWHAPSSLNLAYLRAYDPNLGRWISRDPIEESGGLNLYQYVFGSPINFIDPEGGTPLVLVAGLAGPPGWVIVGAFAVGTIGYLVWDHFANPEVIPYSPPIDDTDAKPIPAPPPAKCQKGKWMCEGRAQYDIIGTQKHVVPGPQIVAYGDSYPEARLNWIKAAQGSAPRGTTARHIMPKCRKIR